MFSYFNVQDWYIPVCLLDELEQSGMENHEAYRI